MTDDMDMNEVRDDEQTASRCHVVAWCLHWVWALLVLGWAGYITYVFLAKPLPLGGGRTISQAANFGRVIWSLFTDFTWNWYVGWWLVVDIAIGCAGLVVITLVGWLMTRCFRVYMPFGARLSLSFAMGIGAVGLGSTFLGFFGQVKTLPAWIMVVVMGSAFYVVSRHVRLQREAKLKGEQTDLEGRGRRRREEIEAEVWEERGVLVVWHWLDRGLLGVMGFFFWLLTFLSFYHGVLFPETYWDSLILYLGHARAIFLEGGFPRKVVLQVGVGLGANYPHLFELTGATIAAWAHRWSPVYLQVTAPMASLATMFLIYHAVLRQTRSKMAALAVALLIRSLPHVFFYQTYASNYSYVMLYSAAFFYCVLRYMDDGLRGYFILASLAAAFGVHVNYLMGSLWLVWMAMLLAGHIRPLDLSKRFDGEYVPLSDEAMEDETEENVAPEAAMVKKRPGLGALLTSRWFWAASICAIGLGAVWYVRNWIVTGNPVYAFFPEIFTGTKHFNPEVLASANIEWQNHGAGIGIIPGGFLDRIKGSWAFFVSDKMVIEGRLYEWNVAWRWAPSVVGLALPGVLIWGWRIGVSFVRRVVGPLERMGLLAILYAFILFAYHYLIGPFYLYHLLGVFGVVGLFMGAALERMPQGAKRLIALWAIVCAALPGLYFGLVGPKVKTGPYGPLTSLRNPGAPPEMYYEWMYGPSAQLWDEVNTLAKDRAVLTHENRHLLFDPSITLVHMDDWEVQQLWDKPSVERLYGLWKLGVRYYLQVPFEFDHPINARLGHREWVETGVLWPITSRLDNDRRPHVLYEFRWPAGMDPTQEDWESLLDGDGGE